MQLDHIELSKLVVSPANMRAKRRDRDIAELIPSIRARGVLVPLLVRPNGEPDHYEIVAGRRRYFAAKAVAEEDGASAFLPCAIMEAGDDTAALEASLIENVERLNPDEVAQWETFARLVKEGRTTEDIAATFGLDGRIVRRVLALGNLLPRIRNLYRTEQIDAATVRHLTLATTAQQREWLKLFDSTEQYAPTGRLLKEWLFGGAAIATSNALFDLSEYTAPIVGDLFEEHQYFSDRTLFWSLQNKAIEEKRRAYLDEGWSDVRLFEPGTRFERWEYEKCSQAKGGRVYIVMHESGAVESHEGYLPRKEAERAPKMDRPAVRRPELSSPLRRYVDLHRHAAVRSELLDHPWLAFRLLLAHAIAGSPLWNVKPETQRADKPDTESSIRSCIAEVRFGQTRRDALMRCGLDPEADVLAGGSHTPLMAVFVALLRLSDEEALGIGPVIMGDTLYAGGEAVDHVGLLLSIDMSVQWQADDTFFALLRDRSVLLSLVEEVGGTAVAQSNADATGKTLKMIVRDCLSGAGGRTKVDGWAPRWLRFPATTYLADVPSPESGNIEEAEVI